MTQEVIAQPSQQKLSLHIYLEEQAYEKIKALAAYAQAEGLIEGHPKGNFSGYAQWCLDIGEQILKQRALQKRGYK